jgi:hypothetical protein
LTLDTAKNVLLNLKLGMVMSLILASRGSNNPSDANHRKFGHIDQITHNACSLTNIDLSHINTNIMLRAQLVTQATSLGLGKGGKGRGKNYY